MLWTLLTCPSALNRTIHPGRKEAQVSPTDVLSTFGLIFTAIGLFYAGVQVRRGQKIARSEFLFRLYELMQIHNTIHNQLTRVGWLGPASVADLGSTPATLGSRTSGRDALIHEPALDLQDAIDGLGKPGEASRHFTTQNVPSV